MNYIAVLVVVVVVIVAAVVIVVVLGIYPIRDILGAAEQAVRIT